MIMAPVKNNGQRNLLATGEPVELARRFCIANRFYGSRVLLGPRTFELASKILVARPIDFLSGVDVRERHEIYEPVSWRSKRPGTRSHGETRSGMAWSFTEKSDGPSCTRHFKARVVRKAKKLPPQLYLRRLEPLALQLTNTPLDE